jgi:hypothetical protein
MWRVAPLPFSDIKTAAAGRSMSIGPVKPSFCMAVVAASCIRLGVTIIRTLPSPREGFFAHLNCGCIHRSALSVR